MKSIIFLVSMFIIAAAAYEDFIEDQELGPARKFLVSQLHGHGGHGTERHPSIATAPNYRFCASVRRFCARM